MPNLMEDDSPQSYKANSAEMARSKTNRKISVCKQAKLETIHATSHTFS